MKRIPILECLVVVSVFASYLVTMCPTVYVGDAGELVAAAARLGVAHPPGYPLFCVWEKIAISVLPFASVAWRANVGMALASCLAAVAVMRLMRSVFPSTPSWGRALTALATAWSSAWWSQGVIAEVYALNSWLFLWWASSLARGFRAPQAMMGLAAVVGLGLSNHHTMLLVGAMWWMVAVATATRETRMGLAAGTGLVIGLMAAWYLYIPLRSLTNPVVDWGNPETFQKVLNHVSRRQYAAVDRPVYDGSLMVQQGMALLRLMAAQIPWWWSFVGFAGALALWRTKRTAVAWGAAVSLVIVIFMVWVTRFTPTPRQMDLIKVFLIPMYALWVITVGGGIAWITSRVRWAHGLWIALPCSVWAVNFTANDLSRQDLAYRYGHNLLRQLSPRGTLMVAGDNIAFPLAVLHGVEDWRPDATIIDRFGNVFWYVYGEEWLDKHQRDLRRLEVERQLLDRAGGPMYYATMEVAPKLPFPIQLEGCLRRIRRNEEASQPPQSSWWRRYDLKLPPLLPEPEVFIQHLRAQYAYYQALFWFERGDSERGWRFFEAVKREAAVVDPLLINLGYACSGRGAPDRAIEVFQAAVAVNPWLVEGYIGWGVTLGNLNRLEEAVQVFREAVHRQPSSAEARNSLGIAYVKLQQWEAAKEVLEENIRLHPHYVDSYNELGLVYAISSDRAGREGRTVEATAQLKRALALWEEVLALAPGHVNARMNAERARRLLISP